MKDFFKNLIGKASKPTLSESQILDILSDAICDVGYWSWWVADLPSFVQIEFGGTQLYFPPTADGHPPSSKIAIQFRNPKSISFLSKQIETTDNSALNWPDDLHHDEIEAPTCSHDYFTFTDKAIMAEIIHEAKNINTIHGYPPVDDLFFSEKYQLVFWAHDYGFAVSADDFALLTMDGPVELAQMPEVNEKWWAYWKRYWELKDTKDALPSDYACEVTIPMKNYKYNKE